MNKKDVFDAWAPSGARWSNWVKPVLFASLAESDVEGPGAEPEIELELSPTWTSPGVALIVDLPGEQSVQAGLALAKLGMRPVPLFNALPGFACAFVDVRSIQRALVASANLLRSMSLPADAPPAFLLDSLRRAVRRAVRRQRQLEARERREDWSRHQNRAGEWYFDNRSLSFSTDFPSGATLREHGVERIILIRWHQVVPGDLVATLAAWHRAGLTIEIHDAASERAPLVWEPPRWLWLRRLWFEVVVPLGLWRDKSGAFGGHVPPASG
ncbi:MAG TPA: hypothetical protein VER11_13360 [Polyangiaceae bacterium]|nr:hypothetical protein [Polyangiaceae bacterium]